MTDTLKHMWDQVDKARAEGTFSSTPSPSSADSEDVTFWRRFWCWLTGGHIMRIDDAEHTWGCTRCGYRSYI